MLSVILINSKIYDRYIRYDYFFNWFEDNSDVSVCIWNKNVSEKADIDEIAPQLFDLVKNASEWNAYIVDEPFDSGDYIDKDFIKHTQCSINPYERANKDDYQSYDPADDTLMRLVYFLGGRGYERLDYINHYGFRAVRPHQIFLLTPRIFENLTVQKELLKSAILEEEDARIKNDPGTYEKKLNELSLKYSDFWNRYEYPANCRFMVFDMPDMLNVKYEDSWFLFWLATMTLIINRYNSAEIGAYTLYRMGLDLSLEELDEFINKFHTALQSSCDIAEKDMENEVKAIKMALEDTTANHPEECAPVYVNFPDTDFGTFYATDDEYGDTKDRPILDYFIWEGHAKEAREETARLFKAISRGKNEAVDAMNRTFTIDMPLIKNQRLSRYDAEDIAEALDKSEIEMLALKTDRYASRAVFEQKEEKAAKSVKNVMAGRVLTKTFWLLTLCGVLVCLFGFIPFIISSAKFNVSSCIVAILISLFACGAVALASYIALKIQRKKLRRAITEYNDQISESLSVIQNGAQIQSQYLSKLLNYMEKYQLLISGRVEEHHLRRLEELTKIHATYQDALDQCKSIAGLCRVKLRGDAYGTDESNIFFLPGHKIYLHEDTDMMRIPLNSIQGRLVPPFPFVNTLYILEERLFESSNYYGAKVIEQKPANTEKGEA